MPDPVTGTIATTALISGYQANRASQRADDANKRALKFDMKKYEDWKKIYGPIEENLSNYYQNLTPESLTAQGLENIQSEFQRVKTTIRENLEQRGLSDSGIEEATNQNLQIQKAIARSKVRQEAPEVIAREKLNFLQGGEQRRAKAEQNISQSLHNQAVRADQNAADSAEAFGNILNIGLQQIPGMDRNQSNTTSTAAAATLRS